MLAWVVERRLVSCALALQPGSSHCTDLARKKASLAAFKALPLEGWRNKADSEVYLVDSRYASSAWTGHRGESGRFGISMREGEWNWAWFLKTKPGLIGKIIACCLSATLDLSTISTPV